MNHHLSRLTSENRISKTCQQKINAHQETKVAANYAIRSKSGFEYELERTTV